MANVTHKGSPMKTSGDLPKVGSKAPDFLLTTGDLKDVRLADFAGKKKVLNIAHSLDTGTCAASARRFNQEVSKLDNTVVLTISNDLPFAQKRFCEAEGIRNVVTLSQMRNRDFGRDYGVAIVEGLLTGLLTRAIVVLDEHDNVAYTELVRETSKEPDYDAALKAVRALKG